MFFFSERGEGGLFDYVLRAVFTSGIIILNVDFFSYHPQWMYWDAVGLLDGELPSNFEGFALIVTWHCVQILSVFVASGSITCS